MSASETLAFAVKKISRRKTPRARCSESSLFRALRVFRELRGERLATLSFLSLLFFASSSFAQAPFYAGKTITIIRGSAPGGVGEMRTRAVANYLRKHVPGNPTIVIEFMAGGGGTKAANHLYRGARADGLIIGSSPSGMVSSGILGEAGVQYDLDKFIYLGSPNSESHYAFFTNRKLGLGSLEKLRAHAGLFPAHFIGLVSAGERSGSLAAAFTRLSDQLEREDQIRSRFASALLYPLLLAVAGTAAVLVLLIVVLPNFAALLVDSGARLPRSTAILIRTEQEHT